MLTKQSKGFWSNFVDRYSINQRVVKDGDYIEILCSSKQGYAILLHNDQVIWPSSNLNHQGILGHNLTIGIQIVNDQYHVYTCRIINQNHFEEDSTIIASTSKL